MNSEKSRPSNVSPSSRSSRRPRDRNREYLQHAPKKESNLWSSRTKEERDPIKLKTDKATILAVLKTDPTYKPPRPMNPNRPPSNSYYKYHEDTGHKQNDVTN